ncbi:MAG: hypothetical protein QHH26_01400 [Armatimonadota bacterium]|nr:hypothetical protein [Armatimonadota bacterium]
MRIMLLCREAPELSARSLAEFIFDLTMLWDRLVISFEEPYNPILYSPYFYTRQRRLESQLELKIGKLSKESPLQIELIIGTAAAAIRAAKIFAEILRLLIKLPLEVESQRLKNAELRLRLLERVNELSRRVHPEHREVIQKLLEQDKDLRRLLKNEIRIINVEEKPD